MIRRSSGRPRCARNATTATTRASAHHRGGGPQDRPADQRRSSSLGSQDEEPPHPGGLDLAVQLEPHRGSLASAAACRRPYCSVTHHHLSWRPVSRNTPTTAQNMARVAYSGERTAWKPEPVRASSPACARLCRMFGHVDQLAGTIGRPPGRPDRRDVHGHPAALRGLVQVHIEVRVVVRRVRSASRRRRRLRRSRRRPRFSSRILRDHQVLSVERACGMGNRRHSDWLAGLGLCRRADSEARLLCGVHHGSPFPVVGSGRNEGGCFRRNRG
jgi:hypothetical protein